MRGKKKQESKKQEKPALGVGNKDHKAFTDPEKVLPKIVKSSGYLEACLVAFDMDETRDESGRPVLGSATLEKFRKMRIVGCKDSIEDERKERGGFVYRTRREAVWEYGPASWMHDAIVRAKLIDPYKFLIYVAESYLANPRYGKLVAYRRMKQMAEVLDALFSYGQQGSKALAAVENWAEWSRVPPSILQQSIMDSRAAEKARLAAEANRRLQADAEAQRRDEAQARAAAARSQR